MLTDKLGDVLAGRTYVVGAGVQKAGTSWLHDYLSKQPDIFMPRRKELHFFDRERPIKMRNLAKLRQLLQAARRGTQTSFTQRKLDEIFDFGPTLESDKRYLDYFTEKIGDQKLFGEVTPEYAMIGAQGYKRMKDLFPRMKVIYLMRDPVDRHHSMLRMGKKTIKDREWVEERFIPRLARGYGQRMSDYPSHIEALRGAFAPHELHIGFYETLFTESEIRRLCGFLEIPFAPAEYEKRVHASATEASIDPDLIAQARLMLAPVYDYCAKNFPDLPASWKV